VAAVRSILLQQSGVVEAEADLQRQQGWAIYDPARVTPQELADALSPYYPSRVVEDRPYAEP